MNRPQIQDLVRTGEYQSRAPELKIDAPADVTPLANIDSSQKVIWAKVMYNFKKITQQYWCMGCTKCHLATLSPYQEEFVCNGINCGEKQKALSRCRLHTDLIDDTGIISATLFGEFAEKVLQMKAIDLMNSTSEALENHVPGLHSEYDDIQFVVKLKASTKVNGKETYIVMWYSESVYNAPNLDSVTVNIEKDFNDVAEGESLIKGMKRSSCEVMDFPLENNKEDALEIPKKTRSKKA